MSLSSFTKSLKCSATFFPSYCVFQDLETRRLIGRGFEKDRFHLLDTTSRVISLVQQVPMLQQSTPTISFPNFIQLHNRLGHPFFSLLHKMFPTLSFSSKFHCEPSEFAKHYRSIYLTSNKRSSVHFYLVHSYMWGPTPTVSFFGFRYFVTFVNDYSRATWVYLLKAKSDVFSATQSSIWMVSTQFDKNVCIFCSNNGGEYISGDLFFFF